MKSLLTVASAASDLSLLTLAELRTAVGDDASDAALESVGARVSAAIVRACGVVAAGAVPPTLRLETLSEQFRFISPRDTLILARRPVVEIISVTENDTTLTADDYEADAFDGLLRRLNRDYPCWWAGGKVAVSYRAGWESVPEDLKLAAGKLAAVFWSEGAKVDPGLRRESIPGVIDREWWVGPSDDPLIPREVMDLLEPYRNR